jgi:hypothetical protein
LSGERNTLSATYPISGLIVSNFFEKSCHFDLWSFEYLSIWACLNACLRAFNFFFFAFLNIYQATITTFIARYQLGDTSGYRAA